MRTPLKCVALLDISWLLIAKTSFLFLYSIQLKACTELKGNFESVPIRFLSINTEIWFLRLAGYSILLSVVSWTDGKISVRINLLFYLFFTAVQSNVVCFFPVVFSSLIWHFQHVLWVLKFLLSSDLWSLLLEFKSLIIVTVGFQNFVCCLAWAVYLGVEHCERRILHIKSFCPVVILLSTYLEEPAFSISISSSVFIFQWLFSRLFWT